MHEGSGCIVRRGILLIISKACIVAVVLTSFKSTESPTEPPSSSQYHTRFEEQNRKDNVCVCVTSLTTSNFTLIRRRGLDSKPSRVLQEPGIDPQTLTLSPHGWRVSGGLRP